MALDLIGSIRRWSRAATDQRQLRMTNFESLAVAMVEAPGVEGNRGNSRFILGNSAAVTGVAPVQALVTTQPQWAIFNNDPFKTYYFEELGVYLTSGTPGVGGTLWVCIFSTPTPVGANTAGCSVSPAGKIGAASASVSGFSNAIIKSSPSAITTPAAPNWFPIASNPSPNVTAFAASTFLEHRSLQGSISIPPGLGLGMAVVAPAGTTPLFAPFGKWLELHTDNE